MFAFLPSADNEPRVDAFFFKGLILRIPPDTDVNQIPAAWTDVVSRSAMARQLLLDPSGAMLNSTLEIQYPDQRGRHPALGDEVLAAARELP
jgi:hypothetical protein